MTRSPRLPYRAGPGVVVSILVMALAVGCAQPGGPATPGSAGPSTPVATTAPTPNATDASGCGTYLAVTEASSGQTVCVHPGGVLTVTLRGAPGVLWRPVTMTGDVLTETRVPAPTAVVAGATTAAYLALRSGTATLQSSRSLCPPPKPGSVACQAVQAFVLTVEIR